ncbi:MAG TPA: cytochrome P450 [Stellaceae bacterium]|nr:cytochrome P450 [Stellaceae bacterium]
MNQDDYNLTNPVFFAEGDTHDLYKRMRDNDPVHWTQGRLTYGFWSIFRYRDIYQVFAADNKTFSIQANSNVLPAHPEFESLETVEHNRLSVEGANLSSMDGARHTALRQAFNERFAKPSIAKLEDLIRGVSVDILNSVIETGRCDFAIDVAAKLPLMVIADIMAVPRADWEDLYLWNNMHASPDDPEFSIGDPLQTSQQSLAKINGYCLSLALERRKNPGDDLISDLATTRLDGEYLTDEQLAFNGLMFFAAGHETTRNTLCAGLSELAAHPDEMQRLRDLRHDKGALRVAVEEFVRWGTPLNHQMRTATEDVEIGGTLIRKGDRVVVWNMSANRDERQFPDPFRFDCQRQPNVHLGFGFGKHFCLGAHLARLEMLVMLEYFLEHIHNFELAGTPQVSASNLFPGIKHMPVTFAPRAPIAA